MSIHFLAIISDGLLLMIHILEIRANLKDLTLTYIKSVNPNLYATDGKKRYEKNLELFVRELHGKGNCPHLLTLNNIYQIAAYSIEQVSYFKSCTEPCVGCPRDEKSGNRK